MKSRRSTLNPSDHVQASPGRDSVWHSTNNCPTPNTKSQPMTARLLRIFVCIGIATALFGCVTNPVRRELPPNASHTWKLGQYVVRFIAGPKSERGGRPFSYSFYQISRKFKRYKVVTNLGIESAMDIQHFQWNPKAQPTDSIKLFISRSGDSLLIDERIPNDCAPCSNHILVVADADGMEYEYLDLPSRVTKHADVFGLEAEVTSISDTQITYRYGDGTTITENLKQHAKRNKHPNYPG
jgi:hypothetical protein